ATGLCPVRCLRVARIAPGRSGASIRTPYARRLLGGRWWGGGPWGWGGGGGFGGGLGWGGPRGTGDLVLQAAQGFHHRLPISSKPFVVLLARSFEACLGDRDAVDRAVQLPVPAPVQPDSAFGLA